jgi:hypothetical protein
MTVSRPTWNPRPEETGPGEKYDACPICSAWAHRIDRRRSPVHVVRVGPPPTIQSGHLHDAVYRCEDCGHEWDVPVATVLSQEVLPL